MVSENSSFNIESNLSYTVLSIGSKSIALTDILDIINNGNFLKL